MFKKISNSLVSPKECANYYKESFGKTFLYLLLLVLLMLIPVVLSVSTSQLISDSGENEIRNAFINEDIPFIIVNGELKNINDDNTFVYQNKNLTGITFYITENEKNVTSVLDELSIVLGKDKVYVKVTTLAVPIISYTEYDYLTNLDFSDQQLINSFKFWDNIFYIMNNEYNKARPMFVVFSTIIYFFYWLAWLCIFACVLAIFGKMKYGKMIKFSGLFKLSIYNLTPFVFCSLFANIFGMQLLLYLGYLLSAIYSFISQTKTLENMYNIRNEGK